jgi:hypothetical protein
MVADGVKVLFIGGYGRSGSTLLERLLGQLPGVFSAGEVRFVWDRGLRDNQLCGCGAPFRDCPIWTDVGEAAFGGWGRIDADEVLRTERRVARHRFLPLLTVPSLWPPFGAALARHAEVLRRLYAGIRTVTGARLVVDSSVDPSYGFLVRRVPAVDLRVAHLVRDSRAVAHSWTRRVARPEIVGSVVYMPQRRPLDTAVRWTLYNSLFHGLAALGVPTARIRYEDLIAEPRRHLERLMAFAGEPVAADDLAFVRGGEAVLDVGHTVSGNPMRFSVGTVPLRVDAEWRSAMRAWDRYAATAVGYPLLRRYGYVSAPAGRSGAARSVGGLP